MPVWSFADHRGVAAWSEISPTECRDCYFEEHLRCPNCGGIYRPSRQNNHTHRIHHAWYFADRAFDAFTPRSVAKTRPEDPPAQGAFVFSEWPASAEEVADECGIICFGRRDGACRETGRQTATRHSITDKQMET